MKKFTKSWADIQRKKRIIEKDTMRKRKINYEEIRCSSGKIRVYNGINKKKLKVNKKDSKNKIVAYLLATALGVGTLVGYNHLSYNSKIKIDKIMDNVATYINNARLDGVMDSDDIDAYYHEILEKNPNDEIARKYFRGELSPDYSENTETKKIGKR